jgi:branched-chain amino acid transport system permease protein
MIWGVEQFKIPEPALLSESIAIFDQKYPLYRLGLERTRFGAVVGAAVDDREMAAVLGINIDRAFFIVFCIGTALAGIAGVLAAPIRTMEPGMDVEILIPALMVVVIGGPGSLKGAALGAFIVGTAETFGPVIVPEFASFIMYAVMAAIRLVRPQGPLPVKPAHSCSAPTTGLAA